LTLPECVTEDERCLGLDECGVLGTDDDEAGDASMWGCERREGEKLECSSPTAMGSGLIGVF
jgi:hypothetical protein